MRMCFLSGSLCLSGSMDASVDRVWEPHVASSLSSSSSEPFMNIVYDWCARCQSHYIFIYGVEWNLTLLL